MPELKSILKPQDSIVSGLATVGVVYGIYAVSLPNHATMHATNPYDNNLESGRKKFVTTAIAVVGAITLLTKDVNIFILGGAATIILDTHAKHAMATSPDTGEIVSKTANVAPVQPTGANLAVVQGGYADGRATG